MNEMNLSKIAIIPAADTELSDALRQVNENFDGGRITKTDLASWFISRAASSLDDASIAEIRRAHFNQVVYLDGLVKKLKSSGKENLGPDDLAALQAMLGQQSTKKRTKSVTSKDSESLGRTRARKILLE